MTNLTQVDVDVLAKALKETQDYSKANIKAEAAVVLDLAAQLAALDVKRGEYAAAASPEAARLRAEDVLAKRKAALLRGDTKQSEALAAEHAKLGTAIADAALGVDAIKERQAELEPELFLAILAALEPVPAALDAQRDALAAKLLTQRNPVVSDMEACVSIARAAYGLDHDLAGLVGKQAGSRAWRPEKFLEHLADKVPSLIPRQAKPPVPTPWRPVVELARKLTPPKDLAFAVGMQRGEWTPPTTPPMQTQGRRTNAVR